mmetsp:Transcript_55827/g.83183  ORF Transcript_55827/g.83183 Transcript_55827/m.83183 type:complete len:82 (+) Transcript_55827:330-575(+)
MPVTLSCLRHDHSICDKARNYSQFEGEVLQQRHPSSVCCRNASPSSVSCTNECRYKTITAVLAVSLATTASSVSRSKDRIL